jgi:hypothetical protein
VSGPQRPAKTWLFIALGALLAVAVAGLVVFGVAMWNTPPKPQPKEQTDAEVLAEAAIILQARCMTLPSNTAALQPAPLQSFCSCSAENAGKELGVPRLRELQKLGEPAETDKATMAKVAAACFAQAKVR